MKTHRLLVAVVATAALLIPSAELRADERLFTYSYEAEVLPKGGLEFEQWITNRSGRDGGRYTRWDLREEIEYGLTDRLTTALYLNFRSVSSEGVEGVEDGSDFTFKGVSSEWKYQVANPNRSPIGVLLYGEVTYDGDEVGLEEKIILQKNFGERWVAVVNFTFEQEWEFEATGTESKAEIEVSGGLACRITPQFSLGVEARAVREFPEWEEAEDTAVFVGPALHYATANWWATLTVMPQVTQNYDGFEQLETRFIAGFNF